MSLIKLNNVSKFYNNKKSISTGFSKINLELNMGEFVVITGESGSGKSTLLNVISGLDSYEEGEMYINGEETSHYTELDYENYRRKYIGNIFQHFNLVNSYTVYQNIELVLLLNGYKKKEIKKKILKIIDTVGLTKYKNTKASKLSGGQKQRVAIARALAKDTPVIVADEPTGALDVKSARSIMKLLKEISANKLVVIVTHNFEQVEEYTTRKISMNDGKIIEDKIMTPYQKVDLVEADYKDLTFFNKFLLGFRNAFNIKTKFVLLMFVYFFLTFLVYTTYSALAKQAYDESLEGENIYFQDTSPERVILKKNDNSIFTNNDLETLKTVENIKKIEKDDLLIDLSESLYNDEIYFYGNVKNYNQIDKVDIGELPKNDFEVVVMDNKDSYYFSTYDKELIGKEFNLSTESDREIKVKIVGLKYDNTVDIFNDISTLYVSPKILNELKLNKNANYSTTYLEINNRELERNNSLYYNILPSKNVKNGEAYIYQDLNMQCSNYDCMNKKINLKVKNINYEDNKDLTVKKILNKDNFKTTMGLSSWEDYTSTIFISEEDYNNLYFKGDYQISVYIGDSRKDEEVLNKLTSMGYKTYYMKDNLFNAGQELMGILNIIRRVIFIIAIGALFFISYFIIKIILKSRNVYFSTIRILGASKKISRKLLNIELFIDINIAYIIFLGVVGFAKSDIIKWKFIKEVVAYFTVTDYISIYIILVIMSLLISNRYSHKLFKDSIMNTYREEV